MLSKGTEICGDESNPHEEIELADWESSILDIGRWSSPFMANSQAQDLEDLDELEIKKYSYLVQQCGYDHKGAIDNLDDCDIYEDMSMRELAEMFVDEGLFGNIPDNVIMYLDFDAIARDLSCDYSEYNGDIFRAA